MPVSPLANARKSSDNKHICKLQIKTTWHHFVDVKPNQRCSFMFLFSNQCCANEAFASATVRVVVVLAVLPWGPHTCQRWAWCCSYSDCTDFSWLEKRQTVTINHSPFTHIQTHFNTLATLNTFVVVVTIAPLKIAHSHSALCNKTAFCVCSLTAESQQTGVSDGSLTQVQNLKTGQMLG